MKYSEMHSVIVSFWYGNSNWDPFYEWEEELRDLLNDSSIGIWDGHALSENDTDGILFFYGRNAEELFKHVKPVLEKAEFMKTATALLTFGNRFESNHIEVPVCG
jgi:hypothetical protein